MADFKFGFYHLSPKGKPDSKADVLAIVLRIVGKDAYDNKPLESILEKWAEKADPSFAAWRVDYLPQTEETNLDEIHVRFASAEEAKSFLKYYETSRRIMPIPDMPDTDGQNDMMTSLQSASAAFAEHTKRLEASALQRSSVVEKP